MDQPRPCTYKKLDCDGKRVGDSIPIEAQLSTNASADPLVKHRAIITLRQLMAVEANFEKRCEEEGWVNITSVRRN